MPKVKKLEIGGGKKPQGGYLHMDIKKIPGVDIVGDVRKLPFKDGELDEIFGHWILEHFYYREIPEILAEWKRVLKKGGLLHLVTNNGQANLESYFKKEINIHELNRMIFGVHLADKINYLGIEDLHKIIWTKELVEFFFKDFSRLEIKETWKHRDVDGILKCPGIKIKAWK
jgi:ubiquinone/menaquinone biosynthesis C-methylase UbiE